MTTLPGDGIPGRDAARTPMMTDSDRALFLARVAWGHRWRQSEEPVEPDDPAADLMADFQDRLAPAWLERPRGAPEDDRSMAGSSDPVEALLELRRMHRAMAGLDLARVHSSWLVRALREESPAVQRLVTASFAGSTREHVQRTLALDSRDLASERAADPEVASWVRALWTERLVGGELERADDPPALIALAGLSPRAGYRLCRMAGICKLVLAGQPREGRCAASEHDRRQWLAGRLAHADPNLRALARHDVETSRSSPWAPIQRTARLGLATIARLLADCEPFRLRWALQHWPYPLAKVIRSLMLPSAGRPALLLEWESLILQTAWDRLNLEGRLALAYRECHSPKLGGTGTIAGAGHEKSPETSLFNKIEPTCPMFSKQGSDLS